MGVTLIGTETPAVPQQVHAARVYVKEGWGDEWEIEPELELESVTATLAGKGVGSCKLTRAYGRVKGLQEDSIGTRHAWNLMGLWVSIRLRGEHGQPQEVWRGRISAEPQEPDGGDLTEGGSSTEPVKSGKQGWVAYSAGKLLEKIHVTGSFWFDLDGSGGGVDRVLDWLPDMNRGDDHGMLVGNRSETWSFNGGASSACYVFGGDKIWSSYAFIWMLLNRYVNGDAFGTYVDQPVWTLGGQVDLLKNLKEFVRFRPGETVGAMIRRLIPMRLSFDYKIVPTDEGFEIEVVVLAPEGRQAGDTDLPGNPKVVRITPHQDPTHVALAIERTVEHQYSKIVVTGGRVRVMCSLHGAQSPLLQTEGEDPDTASLVPKWDSVVEDAYKAGTGNAEDGAEKHDAVRAIDRFRTTFRLFGAPAAWDHQKGEAAPLIATDGSIVPISTEPGLEGTHIADFQNQVRSTLKHLLTREGVDYATDPPVDENPTDHVPEFLPPAVWLFDPELELASLPLGAAGPPGGWVLADEAEIHASVTPHDWGFMLGVKPQHALALHHFDTTPITGDAAPTGTEPKYDHEKMVATIAFKGDQRLKLEALVPDSADDGSALLINVPDAELWYLAPRTVIGVDTAGQLVTSGEEGRVLRNDAERMSLVLAGAMARYQAERASVQLTITGLAPWLGLVGHILAVKAEDGDPWGVEAPITSVTCYGGVEPRTLIRTGYSQ